MRIFHLVEAESIWALSQKGTVNLPQVKTLQDKLRAAGHDPGASDGWYGQKTANAVRAYQEANGLTVDGDAGPQTLASLGMAGANTTPPAETPPAETPPAPSARQPASEPEPAPTQTGPAPNREEEPSPVAGEPERVERAANRGGEALARLVIAGLLGYGLHRMARNAGQTPPPLGSNPAPVIPGTPPPAPVNPSGRLVQGSSARDASIVVQSVSQNEFELTDWTSYERSNQSFMSLELNPRGQLAAGYDRLPDDYRARNEYESTIMRYVRRQIRLIPGNISRLSVSVKHRGRFIGSFDTYLG